MYVLNLGTEGRVLSAAVMLRPEAQGTVCEALPEGDITDYKYIDSAFVYEPLSHAVEPVPGFQSQIDDINLVLADIIGGAL